MNWSVALNGEHYMGYIYSDGVKTEITHKMTTGLAERLNKKDGCKCYKPGNETFRFETKESIIRKGIELAKTIYPNVKCIIVGDISVADPQETVWCIDEEVKNKLNEIWKEQESYYLISNNPYNNSDIHKKMDELFYKWNDIINNI